MEGQASSYHNIGVVYEVMGDIRKAVSYTEKALMMFRDIGNVPNAQTATNNLQRLYEKRNRTSSAS